MITKDEVFSKEKVRRKNYSYSERHSGYYAVDEYYIALRDVGLLTEEEYSKVREWNEECWNERRHENNDE